VCFDGESDPLEWVISHNLKRRHLSESQRAVVGAEIASRKRGGDAGFHKSNVARATLDVPTQTEVAKMLNVSRNSVKRGMRS
jgi:hypothetical protein